MNSAQIGILRMTISQMNVQVVTAGRSYTRRPIGTSPSQAIDGRGDRRTRAIVAKARILALALLLSRATAGKCR